MKDAWGLPALRLTYKDHADDLKTMQFFVDRGLELLDAAGARRKWAYPVEEQSFAFHLLGTCRMGNDPKTSVINTDHRAHDVPNLFICDGSSFVTSGRGQPTLTIQALAYRAAAQMVGLAKRANSASNWPVGQHDSSWLRELNIEVDALHSPQKMLLRLIDEAYDAKAWHGPNLRSSIRGLKAKDAAWRPAPGRHNIWEIVVHAAYWKYIVRRRLRGERRGSFALPGSNWFTHPTALTEKAWREALDLLEQEHRKMRAAVKEVLRRGLPKSALPLISGIAFHDVYHAGQIRLLRRLQTTRRRG